MIDSTNILHTDLRIHPIDYPKELQKQPRRDKFDLVVQLLDALQSPTKKTHIIYKVAINYYQLKKYLALLEKVEAITLTDEGMYVLTHNGRRILDLFRAFTSTDNQRLDMDGRGKDIHS